MKHARRSLGSVDEPNAFRISRPPPSTDPALRHEPPTPPLIQNPEYIPEPASWLRTGELSSPLFNPHDFLHGALVDRFDKPARPSQLPLLDDTFDADAALAALDTVESGLRRMRDASRSEEATARDELRNSLHLAAKKRQSLMATADSVSSQATSFNQVGNLAASALASDLHSLEKHSTLLSELHDARDVLSLFVLDSSALDAVRVSRLLARSRAAVDSGSLTTVLSPADIDVAREELGKCVEDLAKSIFEWMRTAVGSGNSQVIHDCAVAALHLDIEDDFIREYVNCAFKIDRGVRDRHQGTENSSVTESFRTATWEVLSAVKEVISTIGESFATPSKPLASLLHLLTEKHIFAVANDKMKHLLAKVRHAEAATEGRHIPISESGKSLGNQLQAPTISTIQTREHDSHGLRGQREYFLNSFAEILRAITKVKAELFDMCRVPGATDLESVLAKLPDPYAKFLLPFVTDYVEIERSWLDDEIASSFFETTRIESHTPRLAPKERSHPDTYHRYRAFYSHIASSFVEMTQRAVKSTEKSFVRTLDIFRSLRALIRKPEYRLSEDLYSAEHLLPQNSPPQTSESKSEAAHPYLPTGLNAPLSSENMNKNLSSLQTWPESQVGLQAVVQEVLRCVVMNYLANAETMLQAATHLLPACEEDAQMQELWMSGASPLAAYAYAIDVLSQSNTIVDDFLRNVIETDILEDAFGDLTCAMPETEDDILPSVLDALRSELSNGLADLGTEAQVGVRGAVASLGVRLKAIFSNQSVRTIYSNASNARGTTRESVNADSRSGNALHLDPSPVFVSAAAFLEQQLQSVVTTVNGGNKEFILKELATRTREAVLDCWCDCEGPISAAGAIQLISDANAIVRAFQTRGTSVDELRCLSSMGQLFTEGPESLWNFVESKSLTNVEAGMIVTFLRKRSDSDTPSIQKVCQSLGAQREQ